ncbi:hypothetical protein [Bounagaea algeriensis]
MSATEESVPLNLLDRSLIRARARNVAIAAVIVGAALGGVIGLFAGPLGFVVPFAVVAVPLLLLALTEARRDTSLRGTEVRVRALGTRVVDLARAGELDLLVTDVRGARTISLLATGPPKNKTVTLALAMYAGTGGRELDILALRRIADTLAGIGTAQALVLSDLIVAQLRAEARGDAAAERPLYRLGSMAPEGRVAQKLDPSAVARFVAALDS